MSKQAQEVIIVGGSIAGLMCGIMLKHHGYNVTILEKEVSTFRPGYDAGIKIGPTVLEFLKNHDRVRREFIITCEAPMTLNVDGKPKAEHKQTMVSTSWGLFVSILRANYDGVTSPAVPVAPPAEEGDGTVVFRSGAKVTAVKESGKGVQVEFEDVTANTTHILSGDLLVVADGSTSAMRATLVPQVQRKYAGYVCWRGTVAEDLVSQEAVKKYAEKFVFHFMDRNYLLHYTVPTDDGILEPGKRLHNWVWYRNAAEGSPETADMFTDSNGTTHMGTVPRGLVRPKVWEEQQALADSTMPPELAEIVRKSESPFVTKIYDVISPKALFMGNKLFLVGDAQTTIRSNAGMSTSHAAYDINALEKVIEGKMTPAQWEKDVLRYGAVQQRLSMAIASWGLHSKFTAGWNALSWLLLILRQRLGLA